MAATKTSDETAASTLDGTELVRGVQSAANVKITVAQIKTWASNSPALVTPALGTPSSGVATNLTGTAAGLTAGVASAVAASGITGTTLASNVVTSSLTSAAGGSFDTLAFLAATYGGAYRTGALTLNMNVTTDQALTVVLPAGITKYRIFSFQFSNPSISLTTAVGGIYTGASKTGTTVLSAATTYSSLTTNTANTAGSLQANTGPATVMMTATTLYFSLTVAQGSAATCDFCILIFPLS